MKFSVIVPVFDRPDEIKELLESLQEQTIKNFEIIIVEDGSTLKCEEVVKTYESTLNIKYFYKANEKPAIARNYGAERSNNEYFIFVDSDCIIPEKYFEIITESLQKEYVDAFGGPDSAHPKFNTNQKAISYSMTSFFTTGGIRGGGEKIDKFFPRSFNMGISKEAFFKIGGFPVTSMHPGEDMVFSIEILKHGFKTRLIKDAFVYHKRRNTLKSYAKQVFKFGKTRVIISTLYPETFKIFFVAPTLFVFGIIFLLLCSIFSFYALFPIIFYIILLFTDSILASKSLKVALLSIVTSFLQLFGYGLGFLTSFWRVKIISKDEYGVLKTGFYQK